MCAYCSVADIRSLSNLTTSDISDADVLLIIAKSAIQLNSDINIKVDREYISYIDNTRTNYIDSSNTDYYIRHWRHYLGDMDNDGDVDTSDVIVYQVESDGTETELSVSSVDANNGKITLASAPSGSVKLYVTYVYTPVSVSDPHDLVMLACAYLTIYQGHNKVDFGVTSSVKFGNFAVKAARGKDDPVEKFYLKYQKTIRQIVSYLPEVNYSEAKIT